VRGPRLPLHFTQHAIDAMAERDLPPALVERTVFEPEWEEPDPHDPVVLRRFRHIPERGNRVLRVALVATPDEIRIISAFLDRRARPPV